jgi:hypothetical protein
MQEIPLPQVWEQRTGRLNSNQDRFYFRDPPQTFLVRVGVQAC